MSKTIVIGAGIAGLRAAKKLNATLISNSDTFTFLPRIPELLRENHHAVTLKLEQCHEDIIIDEVTKLDIHKQLVHTKEESYSYEYLVIATGARSNAPIPGVREYTRPFYTKEDAKKLAGTTGENIVIIGAGPTGVELACELARNNRVTVLQRESDILLTYTAKTRMYARRTLKQAGVHIQTDSPVTKITKKYVHTNQKLPYDTCIWAAGIQANTLPGLPGEHGIPVNEHLQVNGQETVFACGDCARSGNPLTAQAAQYEADLVVENIKRHQKNKQLKKNAFTSKGSFLLLGEHAVLQSAVTLQGTLPAWIRQTYYDWQLRSYQN